MSSRAFTRIMVDVELLANPKIRRLTLAQFKCWIAILLFAGKSEPRGYLAVAGQPANERDIAAEAGCSVAVARSTLEAARQLHMLESDDSGLEYVHDWHDYNPDPRPSETREAWRERKRRQREDVPRDSAVTSLRSHDTEVKGEGEVAPQTPRRKRGDRPARPSLKRANAWLAGYPEEVAS